MDGFDAVILQEARKAPIRIRRQVEGNVEDPVLFGLFAGINFDGTLTRIRVQFADFEADERSRQEVGYFVPSVGGFALGKNGTAGREAKAVRPKKTACMLGGNKTSVLLCEKGKKKATNLQTRTG